MHEFYLILKQYFMIIMHYFLFIPRLYIPALCKNIYCTQFLIVVYLKQSDIFVMRNSAICSHVRSFKPSTFYSPVAIPHIQEKNGEYLQTHVDWRINNDG